MYDDCGRVLLMPKYFYMNNLRMEPRRLKTSVAMLGVKVWPQWGQVTGEGVAEADCSVMKAVNCSLQCGQVTVLTSCSMIFNFKS